MPVAAAPVLLAAHVRGYGVIGVDVTQANNDVVVLGARAAVRPRGATARGTSPGPATAPGNAPGAASSRPDADARRPTADGQHDHLGQRRA